MSSDFQSFLRSVYYHHIKDEKIKAQSANSSASEKLIQASWLQAYALNVNTS